MLESIQVDGKRLHTAIRYGVSQAILDAVAKSSKRLMCEVVADEYEQRFQKSRFQYLHSLVTTVMIMQTR